MSAVTPAYASTEREGRRPEVRVAIVSADMTLIRGLSDAASARQLAAFAWTPATLAPAGLAPHVVAFDAETVPVEALARCRPQFGHPRSLVLGSMEPRLVVQGFAAGADAWMLRSEAPHDIALALELLARGVTGLSHQVLQLLLSLANIDGDHGRKLSERSGLSPRQFEVLSMAARGLTDQEIADRLVLSVRTVNRHMSDILSALHCSNRNEASRVLVAEVTPADPSSPLPEPR